MTAKKCDRCGTFYEEGTNNKSGRFTLNVISEDSYWSHSPYDICPSCLDELMKWFKNKKENNNA